MHLCRLSNVPPKGLLAILFKTTQNFCLTISGWLAAETPQILSQVTRNKKFGMARSMELGR